MNQQEVLVGAVQEKSPSCLFSSRFLSGLSRFSPFSIQACARLAVALKDTKGAKQKTQHCLTHDKETTYEGHSLEPQPATLYNLQSYHNYNP